MRIHPFAAGALLALAGAAAGAQTLKPGLWEISNKTAGNPQMDQAMAQMQQQLASMSPQQRKQMEAMMAQRGVRMAPSAGGGMTVQMCMTREMVERNDLPVRNGCTTTKHERSGNTVHVAFRCANPPSSGEGEFTLASPESYRSRMTLKTDVEGRSETVTMESSGKWLGADCGSVRPVAPGK